MRPKRALIATAIFLALFGGFTAAAGLDEEAEPTLPTTLSIPARHVGDHGTYVSFRMEGDAVHGPYPFMEFEVLPTTTVHDREGVPHATQPLRLTDAGWHLSHAPDGWRHEWNLPWIWYHALEDDRLINADIVLSEGSEQSGSSVDGLGLIQQNLDTSGAFEATAYFDGSGPGLTWWDPCILQHGLMGATVDPASVFGLFEGCTLHVPDVQDVTFVADPDLDDRDGLPQGDDITVWESMRFTGIGQDGDLTILAAVGPEAASRPIRLWMDPASPYPVQVAIADPQQRGAWDVWVLQDLQRGSSGPQAPAPKAPIDVSLPLFPPALYGLDETAVEHPFLPSEALQQAMRHAEIAGWFDRNPDARLTGLSGARSHVTAANDEAIWSFSFASPDGHASFWVHQGMDPVSQALRPVPGQELVLAPPTSFEEVDDKPDDDPALTAPLRHAPRAADLMALFDAFGGAQEGHPMWILELQCVQETASGCREAGWALRVGRAELRMDPAVREDPALAIDGSLLQHILYLDLQDSKPELMLRLDYEQSSTTTPVKAATPQEPAPAPATQLHWDLPPGRLLAGTGFLAALSALAYFFWPAIKTGTVGLFSRIRGAQSLDHPSRARLHDIIQAEPGIHFQELARRLDGGHGTTEHHLRKLVETGQVLRREAGGYVCFFPRGIDRRVMAAAPALRSDTARQALAAIIDQPGMHGGDIAKRLGVNRGTVSHHLKRLLDAGVVASTRVGRAVTFHATDIGRHVAASNIAA